MGLAEDVLVFLKVEGVPELEDLQNAMTKLGYNLRLAGRDMMRMGGTLQRFGQTLMGPVQQIIAGSDIMQDAFGDVGMALEDIFEATGILDTLAEVLEWVSEVLEANPWLAWVIAIGAIVGIVILLLGKLMTAGGFVKLLIGAVLSAKDAHLTWGETIMWVTKALAGQNEELRKQLTLDAAIAYAKGQGVEVQEKDARQKKLAAEASADQNKENKKGAKSGKMFLGTALGLATAIGGIALMFFLLQPLMEAISPIMEAVGEAFEDVFDNLEATGVIDTIVEWIKGNKELVVGLLIAIAALPLLISGVKALSGLLGKFSGGPAKQMVDVMQDTGDAAGKGSGGMYKTILAVAALIPMVIALVYAFKDFVVAMKEAGVSSTDVLTIIGALVINLGAIMGVLTLVIKLFDGIKSVSWSVIGAFMALVPMVILLIGTMAGFLEVASATRFTAADIAIVLLALSGSASLLIGVIGAVTFFLSRLNNVNMQALAYIITLTGAVIAMIGAFGWFLMVADSTGFEVSEIISIMDKLTVAMLSFIVILAGAVLVIAALAPAASIAWPVVGLVLALGAAALMMGAGFFLVGLGVQAACAGIAQLAQNFMQVLILVPVLFALVGAISALAIAMIGLSVAGFIGLAGLTAFSVGIGLLALALSMLLIPLSAIAALGGAGAVEAAINKIPALQGGGVITAPGLAMVHPDETVVPAKAKPLGAGVGGYQPKEPPMTVTVDVTGAKSMEDIIQRAVEASVDQLSDKFARKYKRSEY